MTLPRADSTTAAAVHPHLDHWPSQYSQGTATALGKRIGTLLSDPSASRAHWGIAITTLDGQPIFGLDEAKLFRPASSAKLFTTAATLAILGPESSVMTGIYGDFDKETGTVSGDLVLVGAGDPSFGTGDLPYRRLSSEGTEASATSGLKDVRALADQLVAAGVRSIAGNVVGDATFFSTESPPEGWSEEDLLWGYGALPSALSIADNEVSVTVTPKALSDAVLSGTGIGAAIQVDERVPYLRVEGSVATRPVGSVLPDVVGWLRSPTNPALVEINGFVTSGHPPIHERLAVADPALYAAQSLYAELLQHQVQMTGHPVVKANPAAVYPPFLATLRSGNPCGDAALGGLGGCVLSCLGTAYPSQVLASHTSPPLGQEVAFTLKTSANLHAEVLLHRLALKAPCAGATTLDGARTVRTWLMQIGIVDSDFVFYDGSGLSTKDLVTPRAEAQLLAYAVTQPWFTQWKAALPIGGIDGTLASRFTQSPLKGHVFAKTGTLGESRALAGYVRCTSGREVIFSILDDEHEPGSSADRVIMDKIVEAIAEFN